MISVRTIVEQSTRYVTVRRRLPATVGNASFYASPSAGLRYLFRRSSLIDPKLLDAAIEHVRAESIVWDVGANVGFFSYAAAHLAGSAGFVLAIEPDVWLASLLLRSRVIQPPTSAPVDVLPIALASEPGVRQFCIANRTRATNYLEGYGSTQTGGVAETRLVMTYTLDSLLQWFPPPDVLKIDVEGAELEVLLGGAKVLASHKPVILCEVAQATGSEVANLLKSMQYRLYDSDAPQKHRSELDCAPWNTPNMLALPNR